jgi:hypothetical protein
LSKSLQPEGYFCFAERLWQAKAVYLHKVVPALVGTFHSEIPIYGYNSAQHFFCAMLFRAWHFAQCRSLRANR